ncbi:nuclear transport factor 2 family protein [Halosimplex pelagicum]|uniref:Nuclear transport factor 2 family protein n=1 Tax=Halosimplex pelagicum TaxID=869886 RepID=A0A7D5TA49_9EURY|nr:nuclear transport factor 2 family protein [Halosimplex pelagicum]QLH80215.1 nuclear transport factor 2 family protein [Halosimplex pelagicum]
MTDGAERARAYYRALDEADYDGLADLLAEGFVHDRPDRTIDGRDRFVAFMREERPQTDTDHQIEAVFAARGGVGERGADGDEDAAAGSVAVQGRLLAADGSAITGFVDVFRLSEAEIERIETYTD